MSATIFKHEFRTKLRSVLIWSLSLVFLIIFFSSMFPLFSDQAALMKEFLDRYPAELRTAFGMDRMDLSTVLGFFSFTFMFVQLCLAIQAANYGVGLVSVEETELTADFLMSKPVSRTQVFLSKLLAALAALTLTNLVIWISSFISVTIFSDGQEYDLKTLLLVLGSILIFQLVFLSVGLLISLLVRRVRSVTPYGLGLGFGAYVLGAFSGILGEVALELVTPFKHFDVPYIVQNAAYDAPLVLLDVAITVVALAASYWLYIRRDVPAVS